MNKTLISPATLRLLVRAYNQSIQSYYFFPDVILCGQHRFEREEFEALLNENFLVCYHSDSFGKLYRLSSKAEAILKAALQRRRHAFQKHRQPTLQTRLAFSDLAASV